MILIIILSVACTLASIIAILIRKRNSELSDTYSIVSIFCIFAIGIYVLIISLCRYEAREKLIELKAFIFTYENSKNIADKVENVGKFNQAVEWNQWILITQFHNKGCRDIAIPDCVDTLKLIK